MCRLNFRLNRRCEMTVEQMFTWAVILVSVVGLVLACVGDQW